jgi:hypothetical protein
VAVVFDLSLDDCLRLNRQRPLRIVPTDVIAAQVVSIRAAIATIDGEGFDSVFVLRGQDDVKAARIIVSKRASFPSPGSE